MIVGLAGLAALVSCNVGLENFPQPSKKHTVYFTTGENSPVTKTGITIDNNTVTPDWRLTKAENVHLFEYQAANTVSVGEDVEIAIGADNLTATFKADFPEDMTIIVDPTDPEPDPSGAKGGLNGAKASASYTYAAVIAQQSGAKDLSFIVPAVQYPDANTLIDPDADFLIGYNGTAVTEPHDYEENVVDLYFDRPVALGRLSLTNFFGTDEFVKSVTIAAQGGMSGSAGLGDIDFANSSVSFTADAEGGITLSYGKNGQAVSDGAFAAYFVSLPGEVTLTSIEVVTDQYCYTKTFDGGKALSLSNGSFKNLKLDLSTAVREAATPENTTWYKASVLEDGVDYLIVSGGQALKNNDGATAGVSVTDNGGVITFEGATDPALVWTATAQTYTTGDNGEGGIVAGHFTLTNGGYYLRRQSNTDILLDTTIPSDKPKYVVWDYDGSYLHQESSETATFFCYYNNGWSTGYTSNGAAPGSDIKTVQIYTSRAPQELAFSPAASAEYDLATGSWTVVVPALTGAYTPVTYALSDDSNPAVATVDADGTVHPQSKGTVKVVATAAGNAQYQAATATYTLRVVDSSVTTNTYIKVTSTADLEVGAQYLLVFEGLAGDTDGDGNPKVFKPILDGNTFSKTTSNALDVVIESGTITSDEFEGSHLTLESGYYLKADAVSRYLYPTGSSSGSGTLSAEATATNKLTIAFDNGIAQIKVNSGSNYLVWSTSSHYFSSNAQVSGSYSTGICLYKLDDGRLPQTLSFSPAEVNYDMAGSAALVKPTLSNAIGTVTYSSSDETIATVDPSSGDVTVKKKGTVEIIASAAGNGQYKPGSASYILVITDSSSTTPVWYKADAIEAGGTYLIVSNGYALQNNGGSAAAIEVEVSNDVIEFDAPASAIFTATASSSYFTLQNNSQYMQRGGSSGSYVPSFSSSQGSYYQWTYDSSSEYVTAKGNSTYYVYYSTGNSRWSMSTSSGDSHKAVLYKLGDGSNPGGGDDPGDDPGEEKYYVLVTSEPASWDGTYLIVNTASDGSGSAMNGTGTASVTISNGKIRSTSSVDSYALTVTSANEVHPNQTDSNQGLIAYDIKFNDGNWLYWYSSKYKQTSEDQSSRHNKCTLYYDNGGVRIMSAGYNVNLNGEALSSNPSKNYLYYSSSSFTMSSSHASDRVQLYKLDEGSNPGGGDDPTPSTSTYSRVSFATGITTGKYLIMNPSDAQVFTTVTSYPNSASISPSNGVISGDYASYEVTITKSGDNYTIQNGSGQYLYYVYTSGDTETRVAYKSDAENWAASSVSSDANGFDLNCSGGSGRQHIYWNNSTAGTFFKLGSQSTGVHLYKKADNP